jgi:hypothetical protein
VWWIPELIWTQRVSLVYPATALSLAARIAISLTSSLEFRRGLANSNLNTSKPGQGSDFGSRMNAAGCPTASVPTLIHHPLEIARDTFPFGGKMLMKALALVLAAAFALGASGCVSNQQPIGDAKVVGGTVPKTRLIMARLD